MFGGSARGLTPDDIQGHQVKLSGEGRIGMVLVKAMKRSLELGDIEGAEIIHQQLWKAWTECKGRWRGAVEYPCESGGRVSLAAVVKRLPTAPEPGTALDVSYLRASAFRSAETPVNRV